MIAYVNGMIEDITEDNVIIDIGGFGVNVRISADTATRLPGIGEDVKLYTYTCVREDAFLLYGFLSKNDLEISSNQLVKIEEDMIITFKQMSELEKIMIDAALIILPGTHYAYLENLGQVISILNSFLKEN